MAVPDDLEFAAAQVRSHEVFEVPVREILSWFGARRRSWRNVKRIREALDEVGLTTVPDFESEYIDNLVDLRAKEELPPEPATVTVEAPPSSVSAEVTTRTVQLADPAHRINRLESANRPPVRVTPDAPIQEAITLMLCQDYSQLPVMQSERDVKGLFSWKSYGSRLASGGQCACVRDGMDGYQEIPSTASLFDAVKIIAEHDCVLIRAGDKTICGIVTAYDISQQFQQLAEPFLLLGDIENHIRYLIGNAFTVEELQHAKDPEDGDREIKDVSDLTFGEYVRLLQNEQNWAKFNGRIDRRVFISKLDKVREIRNDVMHFDPDPMDPADLRTLSDFARFLARWHEITARSS